MQVRRNSLTIPNSLFEETKIEYSIVNQINRILNPFSAAENLYIITQSASLIIKSLITKTLFAVKFTLHY